MSSRIDKIAEELNKIQTVFLENYLSLGPLLRMQYWSAQPKDLSELSLPDKNFDRLKHLYVDSFETLCRLTVVAVALEAIIHHRSLTVPTAKREMTIWEYEAMNNGIKHTILTKYPIHDLFVPFIDYRLRNGIGHHSAQYAPARDDVVYYKQDNEDLRSIHMSYTQFAYKVLGIFSAVELAAVYFHALHVKALGSES